MNLILTSIDQNMIELLLKGGVFVALTLLVMTFVSRYLSAHSLSNYWRSVVTGLVLLPFIAIFFACIPLPHSKVSVAESVTVSTSIANLPSDEIPTTTTVLPIVESSPIAPVRSWLAIVWAIGSGVILIRWFWIVNRLRRLAGRAESFNNETLEEVISDLNLQGRENVRILMSKDIAIPFVYGLIRPTIFLPKAAGNWNREYFQLVLSHEFSHIHRRDAIFRVMSQFALAFHWPNPLVWMAVRKLRLAEERCADDRVLESGQNPTVYANLLVDFAKLRPSSEHSLHPAISSMALRSKVGLRIERILDHTQGRSRPALTSWLISVAAMLAFAFIVGAVTTDMATAAQPSSQRPEATDNQVRLKQVISIVQELQRSHAASEVVFISKTGGKEAVRALKPFEGGLMIKDRSGIFVYEKGITTQFVDPKLLKGRHLAQRRSGQDLSGFMPRSVFGLGVLIGHNKLLTLSAILATWKLVSEDDHKIVVNNRGMNGTKDFFYGEFELQKIGALWAPLEYRVIATDIGVVRKMHFSYSKKARWQRTTVHQYPRNLEKADRKSGESDNTTPISEVKEYELSRTVERSSELGLLNFSKPKIKELPDNSVLRDFIAHRFYFIRDGKLVEK